MGDDPWRAMMHFLICFTATLSEMLCIRVPQPDEGAVDQTLARSVRS